MVLLLLAPNKNECYAHKHRGRQLCRLGPQRHLVPCGRCGSIPVWREPSGTQCRCGEEHVSLVFALFLATCPSRFYSSQSQPPPRLCFLVTVVTSRSGSYVTTTCLLFFFLPFFLSLSFAFFFISDHGSCIQNFRAQGEDLFQGNFFFGSSTLELDSTTASVVSTSDFCNRLQPVRTSSTELQPQVQQTSAAVPGATSTTGGFLFSNQLCVQLAPSS